MTKAVGAQAPLPRATPPRRRVRPQGRAPTPAPKNAGTTETASAGRWAGVARAALGRRDDPRGRTRCRTGSNR